MIERNDPCYCGSGIKWKKCHYPAPPPQANSIADQYYKRYRIILKTAEQIEGIRRSCKLTAKILKALCEMSQPGVTTNELNREAERLHKEAGAIAAPLHYGSPPFPKSICTSVNEVICHGIPNDIPLEKGDIMNIDVSTILDGYYGDCSEMVIVGGTTTKERKLVVDVAHECLRRAIAHIKPGIPLFELGNVIEEYATSKGCSVVYQFVGHGVGLEFHEPPQIPHCRNNVKLVLVPGMTFTVEPMINAGHPDAVIDPVTQWIATTVDGSASAQCEHTIVVTETGHEILTLAD